MGRTYRVKATYEFEIEVSNLDSLDENKIKQQAEIEFDYKLMNVDVDASDFQYKIKEC